MQMRSLHGSGAEMLQISRQGLAFHLGRFHRPQCQMDLTIHSQQHPPVTKQFTEVPRHSVLDCSIPLVDWRKETMHLVENIVYCDCKYYVNY